MRVACTLERSSLASAAKALRDYADSLAASASATAARVAEVAASSAKASCPSSRVTATIGSRQTASGAVAFANGPMCSPQDGSYEVPLSQLLEFGTGIRGDAAYGASHGYEVNMSGRGEAGWTYLGDDGEYHHTHGGVAHRFMANGAEEARSSVASVAREEFGR